MNNRSDRPWYGHAKSLVNAALLAEVNRLKALLPEKENVQRNIAAIEKSKPIDKMEYTDLCTYVDLLARSIP